jgi:hypothetical protein
MSEQGKIAAVQRAATYAVDGLSAFAVVGSLVQILPPLAAFLAVVWYIIQICESRTARRLMHWCRTRRRGRPRR